MNDTRDTFYISGLASPIDSSIVKLKIFEVMYPERIEIRARSRQKIHLAQWLIFHNIRRV